MKAWAKLRRSAVLAAALSAITAANAGAATMYYLSSSSGKDANDGQSPDRAWQHLSKIYMKSISADPFRPGDSILLKRGDQWYGQIRLRANGTNPDPIRIGAYGQGPKPLLDGDARQARWNPVPGQAGVYTTDLGRGTILGAIFQDGQTLRTIYPTGPLKRNDDMQVFLSRLEPGVVAGQFDGRLWVQMPDGRQTNERIRVFEYAGVSLSNSSHVLVENLNIERFSVGFDVGNSRSVTIRHNDIHQTLGIGIYLRSADFDCRVESNTISHTGNTALYVLRGRRNIFRDNWVSHVDNDILGFATSGDHMGIGLQESWQTLVEHNYFTASGGIDFYYEHDSTIRDNYLFRVTSAGAPHGWNLKVNGNIYNLAGPSGEPGAAGLNAVATAPGTIIVSNNTVFNASKFFLMGSSEEGGKIVFSGNIAASTVADATLVAFGPGVLSSHNCFFAPGQGVFSYSETRFSTLAEYREKSGLDRDSIFADPEFLSASPITPLDFHMNPASACNSTLPRSQASSPNAAYDRGPAARKRRTTGAFSLDTRAKLSGGLRLLCRSDCFGHGFNVPGGVYLIAVRFGAGAFTQTPEIDFFLNGIRVTADSASAIYSQDGTLRYFLVRTLAGSIILEPGTGISNSVVDEVSIQPFDHSHGEGAQAIAW
jgi:hypothetical protein